MKRVHGLLASRELPKHCRILVRLVESTYLECSSRHGAACGLHLQPAMSAACWLTPAATLCCMLCAAGCVPFDLVNGDDPLTAERLQQMAAQKEQQWQKLLCNVSCTVLV